MTTLAVIAAGNGTRMGATTIPKALYPVNNKENLWYNISSATSFDSIKVFVRNTDVSAFKKFRDKYGFDFEIISIISGMGDGHAVMNALDYVEDEDVVVMWGDVHVTNNQIFDELLSAMSGADCSLIMPVVAEDNPYVTIITDNQLNVMFADFSKLGENHNHGLHDQSIFGIRKSTVKSTLQTMHNVMWKGGRYISESQELNFMHMMHVLYANSTPAKVYITEHAVKSYNTVVEVQSIEKEKYET